MRNGVTFVTAETGGGKGIYSVIEIIKYLSAGRRVATNMDLYLEHFEENEASIYRLPDKPTRQHLLDMGLGSPKSNKNKHEYGLLVLDEVSLFIDTKRSKEFMGIYSWFKQRRKFHWDILFVAQHYTQIQEEFFKSLCNFLIVCEERDQYPIPFIGPILKTIGLTGNMPEGHYFYKYRGKNELAPLVDHGEYSNRPYRQHYNTDQQFEDGFEFMGDDLVDMRASYSLLPSKYLQNLQEQEEQDAEFLTKKKEDEDMAKINKQAGLRSKMKIIFLMLVIALAAYKFLSGDSDIKSDTLESSPVKIESSSNKVKEESVKVKYSRSTIDNSISELFSNYYPRLNSLIFTKNVYYGIIEFTDYDTGAIIQSLKVEDFFSFGYTISKIHSGILIKKGETEYIVTRTAR